MSPRSRDNTFLICAVLSVVFAALDYCNIQPAGLSMPLTVNGPVLLLLLLNLAITIYFWQAVRARRAQLDPGQGTVHLHCCAPNYSHLQGISPWLHFKVNLLNATPWPIKINTDNPITGRIQFDGQALHQPAEVDLQSSVVDCGLGDSGYIAITQHLLPDEADLIQAAAKEARAELTPTAHQKYFYFQNVKVNLIQLRPEGQAGLKATTDTVFP